KSVQHVPSPAGATARSFLHTYVDRPYAKQMDLPLPGQLPRQRKTFFDPLRLRLRVHEVKSDKSKRTPRNMPSDSLNPRSQHSGVLSELCPKRCPSRNRGVSGHSD